MVMVTGRGAFAALSFPFAVRRRGLGHPDADGVRGRQGRGSAGSERGRYGENGAGGDRGSALVELREGRDGWWRFKRANKRRRRKGQRARSESPPSSLFNLGSYSLIWQGKYKHVTTSPRHVYENCPSADKLSHHSFNSWAENSQGIFVSQGERVLSCFGQ